MSSVEASVPELFTPVASPRDDTRRRLTQLAVLVVPVAIVVIGAWRFRWVSDDAFIDLRVVRNIVSGNGPVFNPGERVEAYSNPLWVAILVLARYALWFVPLTWSAVLLGIACTATGFVFAERAGLRLLRASANRVKIPLGLYVVASVAVTWEFATSGLETGLVFAWIGASWWLLSKLLDAPNRGLRLAIVLGLGPLIRPDMAIFAIAFLVAATVLRRSTARTAPLNGQSRWWVMWLVAAAPTVLYELFRVAYFGLLVANTAIVKSAFSQWLSQGLRYVNNFESPYRLWLPLSVVAVLMYIQTRDRLARGERDLVVVTLAPVVGGLASVAYVAYIGGDFMHGRMVLPGFFAIMMACWVVPGRSRPTWEAAGAVLVWCAIAVCLLRWHDGAQTNYVVSDERSVEIGLTYGQNPVSNSDFASSIWYRYGLSIGALGSRAEPGTVIVVLRSNPNHYYQPPGMPVAIAPAPRFGRYDVVAATRPIGQVGWAAGDRVYIFDELSLANPVSSHFGVERQFKPGHDKVATLDWELARFASPGDVAALDRGANAFTYAPVSANGVQMAKRAMSCAPLSSYLSAITRPLSWSAVVGNFAHAWAWTTMSFSSQPATAERQLCSANAAARAP